MVLRSLAAGGAAPAAGLGLMPMLGAGLMAATGGRLDILSNVLSVVGHGIVVGCDATRIAGNDVFGHSGGTLESHGILLPRGARARIGRALVVENRVARVRGHGIALDAVVKSALVKQNIVEEVGGAGIACLERGAFETLTVENNLVLQAGTSESEKDFVRVGIVVANGRHSDLVGNTVIGVGAVALRRSAARAGIMALGVRSARVRGNTIDEIGPRADFLGAAAGIAVDGDAERADIADNQVHVTDSRIAQASALELGVPLSLMSVLGALLPVGYTWSRAEKFRTDLELAFPIETSQTRFVSAHGNHFETDGRAEVVVVLTPGTCHFADNRVVGGAPEAVAVIYSSAGAVVSANTFSSRTGSELQIEVATPPAGQPPAATVVGNLGPRIIRLTGGFGPPWDAINVTR